MSVPGVRNLSNDAKAGMIHSVQFARFQHEGGNVIAAVEGLADEFAAENAAGSGDEDPHLTYSMSHSLAGREMETDLGEAPSLPSSSATVPRQVMR